jgi:pre-mRNA-splicing factor SYF1
MTYANYLENLKFYEESFKIYEMALDTFSWPVLYEIWILYLSKFVSRYEGSRLERTRDLFESVLLTVQPKQSKVFYLMYADYEEKYGLINHVIEILDRLCGQEENKLENYNVYIAKVS